MKRSEAESPTGKLTRCPVPRAVRDVRDVSCVTCRACDVARDRSIGGPDLGGYDSVARQILGFCPARRTRVHFANSLRSRTRMQSTKNLRPFINAAQRFHFFTFFTRPC